MSLKLNIQDMESHFIFLRIPLSPLILGFYLVELNRMKEKQLNKVKELIQNVVLGMLASEELDNFSHNGKMFYPSSTTRFNVADRTALEQWVLQQLQEDPSMLSMFGNTLNAELIRAHQEKGVTEHVDKETGEITKIDGPPPPGVGLHTTTTLNMRNKK